MFVTAAVVFGGAYALLQQQIIANRDATTRQVEALRADTDRKIDTWRAEGAARREAIRKEANEDRRIFHRELLRIAEAQAAASVTRERHTVPNATDDR